MAKTPSIDDLNKELEMEGVLESEDANVLRSGGTAEMEANRYPDHHKKQTKFRK